jgi:hypothetical protein
MYRGKRHYQNIRKNYLSTKNVVSSLNRSKDLGVYVDIYVSRETRVLTAGITQTA